MLENSAIALSTSEISLLAISGSEEPTKKSPKSSVLENSAITLLTSEISLAISSSSVPAKKSPKSSVFENSTIALSTSEISLLAISGSSEPEKKSSKSSVLESLSSKSLAIVSGTTTFADPTTSCGFTTSSNSSLSNPSSSNIFNPVVSMPSEP